MSSSGQKPGPVHEWLIEAGIDLLGIADAGSFPEQTARYQQWLALNNHGTMNYLERHLPLKYSPASILDGCQSLLLVGVNYFQPHVSLVPQGYGQVALYAWGRDYHKVLQQKLKQLVRKLRELYPDAAFLTGVDATPLSESFFAARAGLGWQGKNTLIINHRYGSWFVMGEVLSTLPVDTLQKQVFEGAHEARCGSKEREGLSPAQAGCPPGCTLCQQACPAKALYAPYQLNASRCLSYLTIEYKQEIKPQDWPLLQDWLFGCDICQRVCPFNRRACQTTEQDFLHWRSGSLLSLVQILSMKTETEFKEAFAGSPLMRAGRSRLLRNAIIVAANQRAYELKPLIKQLCRDDDALVAWHAQQAGDFL